MNIDQRLREKLISIEVYPQSWPLTQLFIKKRLCTVEKFNLFNCNWLRKSKNAYMSLLFFTDTIFYFKKSMFIFVSSNSHLLQLVPLVSRSCIGSSCHYQGTYLTR